MRASTCGCSSVETAADPRPGKCFAHAARPRPRAKPTASPGVRNCREPRGPSAVSNTGAKSASTPAPRSPRAVARPAVKACFTAVNDRAAEYGAAPGSALTAPPSWSAKVMPAPPPKIPGRSLVTTRNAAFCCGVMASASARATSTNGRLWRPRQYDAEGRAFFRGRSNRERSVQSVDDLAADVETETRPADPTAHLGIEAVELLEDPLLLRGGDPYPLVDDVDLRCVVRTGDQEIDAAAPGRVLHRILDEIHDDLSEQRLVRLDDDGLRRRLQDDEVAVERSQARRFGDCAAEFAHVDMVDVDIQRSTIELGADKQLVDDLDEMLRLLLDELEQAILLAPRQVVAVGEQRLRAAVDGGERRPQLVRGRGDKVRTRPLEHVAARCVTHREHTASLKRRDRRSQPAIFVVDPHGNEPFLTRCGAHQMVVCRNRRGGVRADRPLGRDPEELLGHLVPEADAALVVDERDGLRHMLERARRVRSLLRAEAPFLLERVEPPEPVRKRHEEGQGDRERESACNAHHGERADEGRPLCMPRLLDDPLGLALQCDCSVTEPRCAVCTEQHLDAC